MYTAGVAFDTDVLDTIRTVAQQQPDIVARYVRRELRPFVSQQVDRRLRVAPPPARYPIQWASEKQRRAFFATDGFGHGIPYKRQKRAERGWHVTGNYTNTFSGVTISHDWDKSQYVYGPRQQPFHANTGWPYAPGVLQVISVLSNDFAADGIRTLMAQELKHGS